MPSALTPYGFAPTGITGGQVFSGSTRYIKIATNYATAIYKGDPVKMAAGCAAVDTGTTTLLPVGIFLGCTYTDANLGRVFRNFWTASTVASDAYAIVADDPSLTFMIQCDNSGSALAQTAIGMNLALATYVAGSTTQGASAVRAARSTIATTNTLPLRVIDFSQLPGDAFTDTYPNVIVRWNAGMHAYDRPLGV